MKYFLPILFSFSILCLLAAVHCREQWRVNINRGLYPRSVLPPYEKWLQTNSGLSLNTWEEFNKLEFQKRKNFYFERAYPWNKASLLTFFTGVVLGALFLMVKRPFSIYLCFTSALLVVFVFLRVF